MAAPLIPLGLKALGAIAGAGTLRAALSDDTEPEAAIPTGPRRVPIMRNASPELLRDLQAAGIPTHRTIRPPPTPEPQAGILDRAGDLSVDVARAVPGAARSLVGLANIPLQGALEPVEEALVGAQDFLARGFSDARKAEEADFANRVGVASQRGFLPGAAEAISAIADNPAVGVGMLPQILAEMVVGAKGAGRLLQGTKLGTPLRSAAIGEGAISAGHLSADIGAETDNELNRLFAIPGGALVAATTLGGGALISRMARNGARPRLQSVGRFLEGTDPEAILAGGPRSAQNLPTRVVGGALREGLLEEVPQSIAEQGIENIALDRPLTEGLGAQAGLGAVLGGVAGGAFNIPGSSTPQLPPPASAETDPDFIDPDQPLPQIGSPIPLTMEDRPKGIGPARWQEFIDTVSSGITSQEAAREAFALFKGVGPKRRKQLETTPWFKSLVGGAEAEVAGAEAEVDGGQAETPAKSPKSTVIPEKAKSTNPPSTEDGMVDPDIDVEQLNIALDQDEAEAADFDADFDKFVTDVENEGAGKGKQSLDSLAEQAGLPEDEQITLQALAPEGATTGALDTPAGLRGIYAAISGYMTHPAMGNRTWENAKGEAVRHNQHPTWKKLARRADKVLGQVQAPDYEGGPADLIVGIHNGIQALEKALMDMSHVRSAVTLEPDPDGLGPARVRLITPTDEGGERVPGVSFAEDMADVTTQEELDTLADALISRVEQAQRDLGRMFTHLDAMLGQDRIRYALAAGKFATFNRQREATPDTVAQNQPNITKETPQAIRFSRYYGRYLEGSLTDPSISTNARRNEHAAERRLGEFLPASASVRRILDGETRPRRDRSPPGSQLANMLKHIKRTSDTPAARRLAGQMLVMAERMNLHLAEHNNKLRFELYGHEAKSESGAAGVFNQAGDAQVIGSIRLYRSGFNDRTMLHEALHALTYAYVADNFNAAESLSDLPPQLRNLNRLVEFVAEPRDLSQLSPVTRSTLELFQDWGSSSNPVDRFRAMMELITYGLTNAQFQQWMQSTEYTGAKQEKTTVWKDFVTFMKRIFRANTVKNSTFETFLTATGGVLREASTQPPISSVSTNVDLDIALQDLGDTPPPNVQAQMSNPTRAAEAEAATASMEQAEQKRKEFGRRRAEHAEEARRTQAEAAKAEGSAQYEKIRAVSATTAVTPAEEVKRDVTRIDYLGRGVMNAVSGMLAGNKDWEAFANRKLDQAGQAITNWVGSSDSPLHVAVGAVLQGVVSDFGVPKQMLGELQRAQRAIHGASHRTVEAFAGFAQEDPAQGGQAIINYLQRRGTTPEEAAAARDYLMQNKGQFLGSPEEQTNRVESVISIAEEMDQVLAEAKALGLVAPEQADATLLDILDATPKSRFFIGRGQKAKINGITSAMKQNNVVEYTAGVAAAHVFNRNGASISGQTLHPGRKFQKAVRLSDSTAIFVEEGIDPDVLRNKLDAVLHTKDFNLYRVKAINKEGGTAEMIRPKTAEERSDGENAAQVFPAMLGQLHSWTRAIETHKLLTAMQMDNEEAPIDGRYILDTAPEDVPANRRFDLSSPDQSATRVLRQARRPGTWVRLPETAEDKWGPLAGKWVAGPVFASMEDNHEDGPVIDIATYNDAVRVWKKFKTVWSPMTHTQNVAGNFIMSYFHDIPMGNIKQGFRLIMHHMLANQPGLRAKLGLKPLTAVEQELLDEFLQSGATLGQFHTADFDNTTAEAIRNWMSDRFETSSPRDLTNGLAGMQKVMALMGSGLKSTDAALMALYSNQDNMFRLAAYTTYIQNGLANDPDADLVTLKEQAALHAKKAFVDYQISAPWIRKMRGTITPFIAWSYRIIPLMAKLAVTKPWKVGATVGTLHMLNALAYAALGLDDEDEAEERANLAEYMSKEVWGIPGAPAYIRLPIGTGDRALFLGLGNMVPSGNLMDLQGAGVPRVVYPSGPMATMLSMAFNYDPFFERPIIDQTGSTLSKIGDTTDYLFRSLGPNAVVNFSRLADEQIIDGGKKGSLGFEANAWVDFTRAVGLNVREVVLPEAAYNKTKAVQRMQRDFAIARTRRIRNEFRKGRPDWESLDDFIIDNHERLMEEMADELGQD